MFKTNEYFDGNVKSIAYETKDGNATIGVMAKGEYEFGTSSVEYMTVTDGEMEVKMPNDTTWKLYKEFETFKVEKDVKFRVRVEEDTTYRCFYR